MSWELKMISDLSEIPLRNGIYKEKEFQGRGQKIINMKELFGFDFIGNQEMKRVELSDSEKERFLVKEGDLLFARRSLVEDGAGKTSIITHLLEDTTFESSMIRVRLNKKITDSLFYYYYFVSYEGRGNVLSLSTGVNVKGIKGSELNSLHIPLPPLPTQKRIASILSNYDDLIENNLKRIKLLEETAQNIYKEWFVNFRFPNYENTPFNEETGLPLGWEKIVFSELYSLNNGCAFKSEDYKNKGIPILRTRDYSTSFFIQINDPIYLSNDLFNNFSKYSIEEFDFLIIMVGASIGKYGVVLKKDLPSLLNQNQWAIRTLKEYSEYSLFKLFSLQDVMKELLMKRTGAARDFFRASFLKEINVIKPHKNNILEFNKEIEPIMKLISSLLTQNQKLKEARDILLPRLMNRTIEV